MKNEDKETSREKSVVISFRLPESVYAPFREPIERSGRKRSQYFRSLFIENKMKVVISEEKIDTEEYRKYLHLVNKVSNNINQLARLLNGAEKSGRIKPEQYIAGLNNLNSIRLILNSKLGKAAEK